MLTWAAGLPGFVGHFLEFDFLVGTRMVDFRQGDFDGALEREVEFADEGCDVWVLRRLR
jgi:hypothetical protein